MKNLFFASVLAITVFLSISLPAQQRAGGLVEGKVWFWDAMADNPGICVTEVDRYVVDYRVECTTPGFVTVIWQGLPQAGDYIDTLGANWVKMQAFYSFPSGVQQLVGIGVHVKHAEYPPDWSHQERTRKTNTIRTWKPDWDFSYRGLSFAPCIRQAQQGNYQVTAPWGGPRQERSGGCEAVAGDWQWFNGGHVQIHANGVAKGTDAQGKVAGDGTWKCINAQTNTIEIVWTNGGWRDTLRLSADNKKLDGRNQAGTKVWAVRSSAWSLTDCQAAVDSWKWFNGGSVVLDDQGNAQGYAPGSNRVTGSGTWRCINKSPLTIQIIWVKGGWIDTLVLSADGRRLEGTNQQNNKVWAERR